jgi:DNA polymerase-3 subunit epsilon
MPAAVGGRTYPVGMSNTDPIINPWFHTLGVFDLETTGIDVETSRIVSAHVGVIGPDGTLLEQTDWLADPGVEIPAGASAVHGITTSHAQQFGRPAAEVVAEIVAALADLFARGLAVTIYNAPYDLSLLAHEARRYGLAPLPTPGPIIDPLVLDKVVDKYRKGKRTLEAAALHYGVQLIDAHTAGADAVAAGRVAQALALKFEEEIAALASAELHSRQIAWSAEQSASFQDYMRRTKDPAFTTSGLWPQR